MWEQQRDYQKAIDKYLEITDGHFQNPEMLEEIWERTYNLAMNYAKDRFQEVVSMIAPRLVKLGKFLTAGEYYENAGNYERAIENYLLCPKP